METENENAVMQDIKNERYYNKVNELSGKVDKLSKLAGEIINKFNDLKKEMNDLKAQKEKELEELKISYSDTLKFKEPAKYWKERSQELKVQGRKFLYILITIIILFALFLIFILLNPTDFIKDIWFNESIIAAIKWTFICVTLISFIAFLIQTISKAMFSSFHLARDAEERHTLTYFYLALLKDSSVKDDDRKLVMESLFSRSNTGLLKENSMPQMPSVTDVLKVANDK